MPADWGLVRGMAAKEIVRLAYSIEETRAATGIGRTTLYAAIKEKKLVANKCGTRTLILADSLAEYLKSLPKI